MSRKGENIRKRKDGRWEARYIKSRDMNGKIQYGYLYGKTYREVKEKKNHKLSEHPTETIFRGGIYALSPNATFSTVAQWWKHKIRHTVKDSTYSNYEAILKNQILTEIGSVPIRDISNKNIWYLIQKKKEQGLSTGTIHVILSVLKNILSFAQSEGLQTAEPIQYPHVSVNNSDIKIMDVEDYRLLEEYLIQNPDRFHYGILLCMNTGIRVGELSGLRWEDFDFSRKKDLYPPYCDPDQKSGSGSGSENEQNPENHSLYRDSENRKFQPGDSPPRQTCGTGKTAYG